MKTITSSSKRNETEKDYIKTSSDFFSSTDKDFYNSDGCFSPSSNNKNQFVNKFTITSSATNLNCKSEKNYSNPNLSITERNYEKFLYYKKKLT